MTNGNLSTSSLPASVRADRPALRLRMLSVFLAVLVAVSGVGVTGAGAGEGAEVGEGARSRGVPGGESRAGGEAGDGGAPRIEIRRRSGLAAPDREAMREWHRRYGRLARPVKRALTEALAAKREHLSRRWVPSCRRLADALQRFRAEALREDLFPLPDAAADLHLKRLYHHLEGAAEACVAGRWAASDEQFRQAGQAFRHATLALGRWGIEP